MKNQNLIRTETIQIRVSRIEKTVIRHNAAASGLAAGNYLRMLGMHGIQMKITLPTTSSTKTDSPEDSVK